ncbi:hypothetical protein KCP78_25025 [Salmonella enterica subsp. enterica]|nr:hypothetical protein KCP78_25025 [Salmonella enterica subsp. enterica]
MTAKPPAVPSLASHKAGRYRWRRIQRSTRYGCSAKAWAASRSLSAIAAVEWRHWCGGIASRPTAAVIISS